MAITLSALIKSYVDLEAINANITVHMGKDDVIRKFSKTFKKGFYIVLILKI